MKKLTLLLFAMLTICSASAQETIKLTVSGQGATKEEATANALRSAIEQSFGVFVSANTQILNDEVVKDEIATISSGNIQKYKELGCITMPNGQQSITLSATVSIGNLISYAKSKGSSAEFAGQVFAMNMKMRKLNAENEAKALSNLIAQLDNIVKTYGLFDVTIEPDNVPYKTKCYYPSTHESKESYGLYLTLNYKSNENSKQLLSTLLSTLESLSLSKSEIETFIRSNEPIYKLSLVSDAMYNSGGTFADYYTTYSFKTFYLRNNPSTFANSILSVIRDGLYSTLLFQIKGVEHSFQISALYDSSRRNTTYMEDHRDYSNFKQRYSHDYNWGELIFSRENYTENTILTYAVLPRVSLLDDMIDVYGCKTKDVISDSQSKMRDYERVNLRDSRNGNSTIISIYNLFDYNEVNKIIYKIKFDFPFTEEQLGKCEGFEIKKREYSDNELENKGTASESQESGKTIEWSDSDEIFIKVPKMPSFLGGTLMEFRQWLQSQIVYPKEALEKGVGGRVLFSFVVEKDGSVSSFMALQAPDKSLSNEVERVLMLSPKWEAGEHDNKKVRVKYTLTVTF